MSAIMESFCAVGRPAFSQVLRCGGGARVKHQYGPGAELVMVRLSDLAWH
jgi:hypothetical protein